MYYFSWDDNICIIFFDVTKMFLIICCMKQSLLFYIKYHLRLFDIK